jgi:hypothetical protein
VFCILCFLFFSAVHFFIVFSLSFPSCSFFHSPSFLFLFFFSPLSFWWFHLTYVKSEVFVTATETCVFM